MFNIGGGTFDDKDLFGVSDGGEYTPDKGRIGGLYQVLLLFLKSVFQLDLGL